MAITITDTKIDFGNFSIEVDPSNNGIIIDGSLYGRAFNLKPMQGEIRGYATDGTIIASTPFASDTSFTDTGGDLVTNRVAATGVSSFTDGYIAGGTDPNAVTDTIDKFPFASFTNAAQIGTLDRQTRDSTSVMSTTDGYIIGGADGPTGPQYFNRIQRLPFAADDNGGVRIQFPQVGQVDRFKSAAAFSGNDGYILGGMDFNPTTPPVGADTTVVEKFPFAAEQLRTRDVGDLDQSRRDLIAFSSTTHGYETNGKDNSDPNPAFSPVAIRKFPFAVDEFTTTSVGDMQADHSEGGSFESTTNGYVFKGTMDKVSFASDINAVQISADTSVPAGNVRDRSTAQV